MTSFQKGTQQYTTYDGGEVYEGGWNKDGCKDGVGKLKLADGSTYEGRFASGFFSGLGVLIFADGSKYEGEFVNGKCNGFGTFTRGDGMRFEGRFQEGRVLGNGQVTFGDGTHGRPRCEGYFEGNRLLRRELSSDIVRKVRQITAEARRERLKNTKDGVH